MSLIVVYVLSGLITNAVSEPVLYDQRQTGDTNVRIDIKDATFILMEGELGDYDYSYDYSDLTVKPETMQSTEKPILSSSPSPPTSPALLPSTSTSTSSGTTTSSTTTTEPSTSTTVNSTFVIEQENNTLTIIPNKQDGNSTSPDKIQILEPQQPLNSHNYQIPVVVIHEKQAAESEQPSAGKPPEKNYVSSNDIRKKNNANVTSIRPEDLPTRNCSPGFFLDSKNRCKKIRKPLEQRRRPQLPLGLRFAQRPEAMNA